MVKDMKEELRSKEVLAMYDIRGIQNYIFKSNDLQEIIGASDLVENIIIDGLKEVTRNEKTINPEEYLTEWKEDKGTEFIEDNNVKMQVMFIGGGNAYVLFRTSELCSKINRKLARYVMEHTYSLNLAIAVVRKTENYKDDYDNINDEMRHIKSEMPDTKPIGLMPFMKSDRIMGYPLSIYGNRRKITYFGKEEYLCTESWIKRETYHNSEKAEGNEKILDNMVTKKGDNSTLAIIHIDGNNMGKRLMKIMEKKVNYKEAIETIRNISKCIDESFKAAYRKCEDYVEHIADNINKDRRGKLIRKIILAGDDVTFICNAEVALGAVEIFLKEVYGKCMYEDKTKDELTNLKEYGLSACGGIAYFNSHFPIRDAYNVAESCCSSAKKRAKAKEHRNNKEAEGNIGSYLDFQICMNVNAGNLEKYRETQYYVDSNGEPIIKRPYYVGCPSLDKIGDLNDNNKEFNIDILKENLKYFNNLNNIPRSQSKKLRNTFAYGQEEVENYICFLKSRDRKLPDTDKKSWYDALEIMDFTYEEGENKDEIKD